jgi:hypothetical protein
MKVKPFYPLIAALLLGVLAAVGVGFNIFFLVLAVAIVFIFHERIQKSGNRALILSSLSAVIFFAIFAMVFSPGGGADPSEPIIINYLLTIPLTVAALTLMIHNEFTMTQLVRGGIRTAVLSPLTDIPFFFIAIKNLFTRNKTEKSKLATIYL